jgi:hypothetical protein
MKIWLDDERTMPEGYDLWLKTAHEAKEALRTGKVTRISLDHDLGFWFQDNTGYEVAKFIEEGAHAGWLPFIDVSVHSANP